MSVTFNTKYLQNFIKPHEFEAAKPKVMMAHNMLHTGTGLGSEFTGWLDLPFNYDKDEFSRIKKAAKKIRDNLFCHY